MQAGIGSLAQHSLKKGGIAHQRPRAHTVQPNCLGISITAVIMRKRLVL